MAESKEDLSNKLKGAVLGAFLADAATMPLHWIYDQDKVAELAKTGVEFHDPPSCPFYEYPAGILSPYGAENLPLLKSLVAEGKLDGAKAAEETATFYKEYSGRLNHTAKAVLENWAAGKRFPETGDAGDTQANCLVRAPLITARYYGAEDLDAQLEAAIKIQQGSEITLQAGKAVAAIVSKVVAGSTPQEAVAWAVDQEWAEPLGLKKALVDLKDEDHAKVAKELGLSCQLPGAIGVALAAVQRGKDYEDAVRINIASGGDNCSRAAVVGAIWGAHAGASALPAGWLSKWTEAKDVSAQIDALIASRS